MDVRIGYASPTWYDPVALPATLLSVSVCHPGRALGPTVYATNTWSLAACVSDNEMLGSSEVIVGHGVWPSAVRLMPSTKRVPELSTATLLVRVEPYPVTMTAVPVGTLQMPSISGGPIASTSAVYTKLEQSIG